MNKPTVPPGKWEKKIMSWSHFDGTFFFLTEDTDFVNERWAYVLLRLHRVGRDEADGDHREVGLHLPLALGHLEGLGQDEVGVKHVLSSLKYKELRESY